MKYVLEEEELIKIKAHARREGWEQAENLLRQTLDGNRAPLFLGTEPTAHPAEYAKPKPIDSNNVWYRLRKALDTKKDKVYE